MLTIEEIFVTVVAMLGVLYNSAMVIAQFERSDTKKFVMQVWLYALFVVAPQASVILYAFFQMRLD